MLNSDISNFKFKISQINPIILGFLFLLLHFENKMSILGIPLSIFWKIIFLAYLSVYLFVIKKDFSSFIFVAILLSIKMVINVSFPQNTLMDLPVAANFLFLPLLISYFVREYSVPQLIKITLTLATFYILSSLPFLTGVLESTNKEKYFIQYLTQSNLIGFTGIFWSMSISSKVYVASTFIILFSKRYFSHSSVTYFFWVLLSMLGIFLVIVSFTRNGWVSLIIGVFTYFMLFEKRRRKVIVQQLIALSLIIGVFYFLINLDESFGMRLKGETVYRYNDQLDLDQISSGRLTLIKSGIKTTVENGVIPFFLGFGVLESIHKNEVAIGRKNVVHNKWIAVFQYSGILGLILFLLYYLRFWRIINNYRSSDLIQKKIVFSLFIIYFFWTIVSHGSPIYCDFMFAGLIAISIKSQK